MTTVSEHVPTSSDNMADGAVVNMDNVQISEIKVIPCTNSSFIQPSRVVFEQNGVKRTWDYIRVHDGVYILMYNTNREAFVLVKQFRPALYMTVNREQSDQKDKLLVNNVQEVDSSIPYSAPYSCGVSYELCAGIIDKQSSLQEVARDEMLEECGYDVPLDKIHHVTSWRGEIGYASNKQILFYAEVTDDMLVSGAGGGNLHEGEQIEIFYLPVSKMRTFMYDEEKSKESSLMFAFSWWTENIQMKKCNKINKNQ